MTQFGFEIDEEFTAILYRLNISMCNYWIFLIFIELLEFNRHINLIMTINVTMPANVFYAMSIFHRPDFIGLLIMGTFGTMIVSALTGLIFVQKYGKRNVYIGGTALCLLGTLSMLINTENITVVIAGLAIRGLGAGLSGSLILPMLSDTVEYGE